MELSEQLRTPEGAAVAAAVLTAAYIHAKHIMNNEPAPPTSAYCKPAALNALMVYVIVSQGASTREKISTEAF